MTIKINCYSDKGLCVTGINQEQAQAILGNLGKAVTQYNPKLGGYVFSRKREDQIREIVAGFNGQTTPPERPAGPDVPQGAPAPVLPDSHTVSMPDGRKIRMERVKVGKR